jgi:hypothetical protein
VWVDSLRGFGASRRVPVLRACKVAYSPPFLFEQHRCPNHMGQDPYRKEVLQPGHTCRTVAHMKSTGVWFTSIGKVVRAPMHMAFRLAYRPRQPIPLNVLWVAPPMPGVYRHTNHFHSPVNPSRLSNHAFLGSRLKPSSFVLCKASGAIFSYHRDQRHCKLRRPRHKRAHSRQRRTAQSRRINRRYSFSKPARPLAAKCGYRATTTSTRCTTGRSQHAASSSLIPASRLGIH